MNNLGNFDLWLLLFSALLTAALAWLVLWLGARRIGRRLRRLLDRSWQPVFVQPYVPPPNAKPQEPG